jgi:hypothetical protein
VWHIHGASIQRVSCVTSSSFCSIFLLSYVKSTLLEMDGFSSSSPQKSSPTVHAQFAPNYRRLSGLPRRRLCKLNNTGSDNPVRRSGVCNEKKKHLEKQTLPGTIHVKTSPTRPGTPTLCFLQNVPCMPPCKSENACMMR